MTQEERRLFLIRWLLDEQPQYKKLTIPKNTAEQKSLLRSLLNVRMPCFVTDEFLQVQDAYLQEEIKGKGITDIADLQPIRDNLYLWQGDITTLRCKAIVNAANGAFSF